MSTGLHRDIAYGEVHIVHSLEYADATAREGATGFTASDIGRVAKQLDNTTFWILVDDDPITWNNLTRDPSTYIAEATVSTNTTATDDVLVNSMTLTPPAGTYLVWFSGSTSNNGTNGYCYMSIYAGDVQEQASERIFRRGGGQGDVTSAFSCLARVTVDGEEDIEGKWRVSGGTTGTMYQRTLVALKVTNG